MSQINQRLDNILAICEPVMAELDFKKIKIEVNEIKKELQTSNNEYKVVNVEVIGANPIVPKWWNDYIGESFECTDDCIGWWNLTERGRNKLRILSGKQSYSAIISKKFGKEIKSDQKFIITYYCLSELIGYFAEISDSNCSVSHNIERAKQFTISEIPAILSVLTKDKDPASIFGLLPAPVKEGEKGYVIKCRYAYMVHGIKNDEVVYLNFDRVGEVFTGIKANAKVYDNFQLPSEIIKYGSLYYPNYRFEIEKL